MSSARFRILRAALLLPLPLLALLGLLRSPPAPTPPAAAPASRPAPPEPARLAPAYAEAFAFFANRPASPAGPGLFATNHFVPPPPPPPAPAPPAPAPPPRARLNATYRGFASFANHTALAYLAVGERILAIPTDSPLAEGWRLLRFDADAAEIARGEERLRLPFRQPVALPAPPEPAAP